MQIIEELVKELKETWGYETEELNDIREKLCEVANAAFWEGYLEKEAEPDDGYDGFISYGKTEDFE